MGSDEQHKRKNDELPVETALLNDPQEEAIKTNLYTRGLESNAAYPDNETSGKCTAIPGTTISADPCSPVNNARTMLALHKGCNAIPDCVSIGESAVTSSFDDVTRVGSKAKSRPILSGRDILLSPSKKQRTADGLFSSVVTKPKLYTSGPPPADGTVGPSLEELPNISRGELPPSTGRRIFETSNRPVDATQASVSHNQPVLKTVNLRTRHTPIFVVSSSCEPLAMNQQGLFRPTPSVIAHNELTIDRCHVDSIRCMDSNSKRLTNKSSPTMSVAYMMTRAVEHNQPNQSSASA